MDTAERILVIDDDADINAILKRFLEKKGYEVETASSGAIGEKLLHSFKPHLVMSDYRLDDMDGAALLSNIKQLRPDLPVIIITGYSDLRTAVRVIRLGAFDYVTKPLIPDEILLTIKKALSQPSGDQRNSNHASTRPNRKNDSDYLFSSSVQSKNLEHQVSLVATTDYSVIVYGESGVGKEGIARIIHQKSKRSNGPFVAMDCGAISRELAGSELLGHEKGSFTGALNQKIGHFEMAKGGTLFLDEVANLPYEVQTLLLRVVQEKKLRRIGGNREIDTDVRLIVASNERLSDSIQKGKFREDLFHRLNEFSIEVPPLRKRKPDILFFANHFLKETCDDLEKNIEGFEPDVVEIFENYPWYGNVRELKNVLKRAALINNSAKLELKSLPFELVNYSQLEFSQGENESPATNGHINPVETNNNPAAGAVALNGKEAILKKAAHEAEYETILSALAKANYNKTKAAELLGVNRKTLYNKMKQMNIKDA